MDTEQIISEIIKNEPDETIEQKKKRVQEEWEETKRRSQMKPVKPIKTRNMIR